MEKYEKKIRKKKAKKGEKKGEKKENMASINLEMNIKNKMKICKWMGNRIENRSWGKVIGKYGVDERRNDELKILNGLSGNKMSISKWRRSVRK